MILRRKTLDLFFIVLLACVILPFALAAKPKKSAKQTFLIIKCQVPTATVTVDGILAGTVNTNLEVDPGTISVQVSAPGYIARKARVSVRAASFNTVTLNLSKPTPKQKPKPKPAAPVASNPSRAQSAAASQPSARSAVNKGAPKPPRVESLFDDPMPETQGPARDLQSEFAMDQAIQANPQPFAPQPYAPQPYAPQQAYPTMPYGPTYPPAYSPYQQPYQYPQPQAYAPPPPMYIAPQYTPPPPAYTQPTYVTPIAPIQDPYSSSSAASVPSAAPPPPNQSPANENFLGGGGSSVRSTSRNKKKSVPPGTDSRTIAFALLPLGSGQFYQGKTALGLIFAGAQIGGLYYFYDNYQLANQAEKNATTYYQTSATEAQKTEFSRTTQQYIAAREQDQMIGLGIFGASYTISFGEAVLNPPAPAPSKNSKRSRRQASLNEPNLQNTEAEESSKRNQETLSLNLGIVPDRTTNSTETESSPKVGVGAQLNWSF